MTSERRASARVIVGLEATYQLSGESGSPQLALSRDVSHGGIRLWNPKPLEPGRAISLSLSLPNQDPVVLRGVVVWCRESTNGRGGFQAGIRWMDPAPTAQARLNAFLSERTPPAPARILSISKVQPAIVWWRAITLALLGFVLLAAAAFLWLFFSRFSSR